ncbi:hypothetical protein [Streptomyces sp. NPDC101150]|uniref:hypothetical protein n=1 Tax=Streptomyces sp. NPDC101150 TaxID=3366114 RepID=UPI0038259BB9
MHPPGARRPRTVRRTLLSATAHRTARTALVAGLLSGVLGTTAAALATAQPADGRAPGRGLPHGPVPTVSCGRPDSPSFPIDSRVRGGPAAYPAGGDWGTWQLELRNTTDAVCEDVHPIVVLTSARHGLRPGRIRLEYRDPAGGDWRPVPFEATDHEEQIGVFAKSAKPAKSDKSANAAESAGAGGPGGGEPGRASGGGLAVPANGTVTVPIRLRFAAGTAPGPVTANVTTVQRRGSDGEWIGQSGDYRFAVQADASAAPASPEAAAPPDPAASPAPAEPRELAATAQGPVRALAVAAGGLFAAGALLLAGSRRLRR